MSDLLERRRAITGRNTLLFYDRPLEPVRGEDVWLFDRDGRRYLDVYNNVPHVGHCHPHVVDALCRQARTLNVHTRYLHEEMIRYSERLTATFDDGLDAAVLTCTGTESNEVALRIARHLSGHSGIIVSDYAYHGHSLMLAQATTAMPAPEAIAPNVRVIRVPDLHDVDGAQHDRMLGEALADVEAAVRSLKAAGFGVAALLLDTIFSTEGLPAVPADYLARAVEIVRRAGGFFIADEVQPGFGRTGAAMWGHQVHGVVPDFATMGKPMGNGHPLAGMVTTRDLLDRFADAAIYFNTFGGNPVSAAVGNAVLDVIEDQGLVANAAAQGAYVRDRLTALQDRHPAIASVRGTGLFFGIELVRDRATQEPAQEETNALVNRMREEGVLLSRIGRDGNILKMRPPMTFQRDHADLLVDTLDQVLGTIGFGA